MPMPSWKWNCKARAPVPEAESIWKQCTLEFSFRARKEWSQAEPGALWTCEPWSRIRFQYSHIPRCSERSARKVFWRRKMEEKENFSPKKSFYVVFLLSWWISRAASLSSPRSRTTPCVRRTTPKSRRGVGWALISKQSISKWCGTGGAACYSWTSSMKTTIH